jgi:hypothetical protein
MSGGAASLRSSAPSAHMPTARARARHVIGREMLCACKLRKCTVKVKLRTPVTAITDIRGGGSRAWFFLPARKGVGKTPWAEGGENPRENFSPAATLPGNRGPHLVTD